MPITMADISFVPISNIDKLTNTHSRIGLFGKLAIGSVLITASEFLEEITNFQTTEEELASKIPDSGQIERLQIALLAELQRKVDEIAAFASQPPMPANITAAVTHGEVGDAVRLFTNPGAAKQFLIKEILECEEIHGRPEPDEPDVDDWIIKTADADSAYSGYFYEVIDLPGDLDPGVPVPSTCPAQFPQNQESSLEGNR